MKKKQNDFSHWYVWFLSASFLIISLLFYLNIPKYLLTSALKNDNKKSVSVLLKNEEQENFVKDENAVILSDEDNQAQGKLTHKKNFSNFSDKNDLAFARKGEITPPQVVVPKAEMSKKDSGFLVKFVRLIQKKRKQTSGRGGWFDWAKSDYTKIPDNYSYQKEFALSWDKLGQPIIPTKNYEHYQYFRDLIDKIRRHWYPPGGSYYPPIGDDFFTTSGFAPGYTRIQTFPGQEIQTIFMLDKNGNVIDAKIYESLGYSSLDQSCLDAITTSKNFGPPPPELLKRGTLIIPFYFRIITE